MKIEYFKPSHIQTFRSWCIWYNNIGYRIIFRIFGITFSWEIE